MTHPLVPPNHLLSAACVCGHVHVDLCRECSCVRYSGRCNNCGGGSEGIMIAGPGYIACSRRCELQIHYALGLLRSSAA